MRALFILLALALCLPALAGPEPDWEAVKGKILQSRDYCFRYQYRGPSGQYRFSYAYRAPGLIRAEILPGSQRHSGTVVLYDSARSTDYVTVRTGMIQLRRSTRSKDVADTSLVTPLLHQILSKVEACGGPSLSLLEGLQLYEFKGTQQHQLWVDDQKDVRRYRVSQGGKTVEELEFESIQWNTGVVPAL